MTLQELKALFRQKIKVVVGGPATLTRGVGMLAVLDALAKELKEGAYTALTLPAAQALPTADPPAVVPGALYGITGDWNAAGTDATVYAHGVKATAYHTLGVVYDAQGVGQLVEVDVVAGTYAPLPNGEQLLASDNDWTGSNTFERDVKVSDLLVTSVQNLQLSTFSKLAKAFAPYLGSGNTVAAGNLALGGSGNTVSGNGSIVGSSIVTVNSADYVAALGLVVATVKNLQPGVATNNLHLKSGTSQESFVSLKIGAAGALVGIASSGPPITPIVIRFRGAFNKDSNYDPGDTVVYGGDILTAKGSFTAASTNNTFTASLWVSWGINPGGSGTPTYDDSALKASIYGRFGIAGFKPGPYKAGDEIIRPDGLARVAAKKDFTTTSSYVATDWLVTDAVLTPQQAAPLQFPALLYDAAGSVQGYANADDALANSSGKVLVIPGQSILTVTTENARGPLAIYSNGGKLLVANGANLRLNAGATVSGTTIDYATAGGTGTVEIVGGSGSANSSAGAVQLLNSTIYPAITLTNSALRLHTNSLVANVNSNGTVYLFDSSAVLAHDAGVTVVAAASGGTSAPATSIDYASEIAVTADTTAIVYKAYVLQGAGATLTLPLMAGNGQALFVRVDSTASGLFAIANADAGLKLWAGESATFRQSAQGWRKAADLRPMTAEIQTSLAQQDGVTSPGNGQAVTVPFSVVAEANGPAGLVNIGAASIVVQRSGRAALRASVSLKNVVAAGGYALYLSRNGQFIASANLPAADFGGGAYLAIGEVTKTAKLAAGDVLTVAIYTSNGGNYRGQYDGSQAIFSYVEFV